MDKIVNLIKNEDMKDIILNFKKDLILKYPYFNDDHRGSDHCLIELPKKM